MSPQEIINQIKHCLETGLDFSEISPPREALGKALKKIKDLEAAITTDFDENLSGIISRVNDIEYEAHSIKRDLESLNDPN